MMDLTLSPEQKSPVAPWLKPLWDSLDFDQIPNAILLHGQSGIGKFAFALEPVSYTHLTLPTNREV